MKLSLLPLLASVFVSVAAQADIVVIAHASSPLNILTREEIGRIYMKRMKNLPRAKQLELFPVSQSSVAAMQDAFYLHVTDKDQNQLRAYWARLLFTGKDKPPKDGKDDEGVKRLVAESPGTIGFIQSSALSKEFKVLYRIAP